MNCLLLTQSKDICLFCKSHISFERKFETLEIDSKLSLLFLIGFVKGVVSKKKAGLAANGIQSSVVNINGSVRVIIREITTST